MSARPTSTPSRAGNGLAVFALLVGVVALILVLLPLFGVTFLVPQPANSVTQTEQTVAMPFTGAWTASVNFRFVKVGKHVTVEWDNAVNMVTAATTLNVAAGTIPAAFRPPVVTRAILVAENGGVVSGLSVMDIHIDGGVQVFRDPLVTSFTPGTNGGFLGTDHSWLTA